MNGHALKELARAWATVAHDGVSRKGAGEPYINHPERMANSERIWGWRQQALCWLHDTIEDAPYPETMEQALRTLFPADLVDDLMLLSRLPLHKGENVSLKLQNEKQPYQEWIEVIAASGRVDVIAVKLADLEDNLRDIRDVPGMQSQEAKYLRAKATLMDAQS